MSFDLNKHTFRLLRNEPFFSAVSRRINKSASTAIPTAGVKLNRETAQFEMLYNPEFFAKLSDEHKQGVLMHEFYHIIYGHVTDRLPEGGMNKLWNIATDLAINSYLQGKLPEGCCMPQVAPFEDYPLGKASEWYYAKLKKDQENGEGPFKNKPQDGDGDGQGQGGDGQPQDGQGQPSNGGGGLPDTLDDHSGWGEAVTMKPSKSPGAYETNLG